MTFKGPNAQLLYDNILIKTQEHLTCTNAHRPLIFSASFVCFCLFAFYLTDQHDYRGPTCPHVGRS